MEELRARALEEARPMLETADLFTRGTAVAVVGVGAGTVICIVTGPRLDEVEGMLSSPETSRLEGLAFVVADLAPPAGARRLHVQAARYEPAVRPARPFAWSEALLLQLVIDLSG